MNNKIKLIGFGAMVLGFVSTAILTWTQEKETVEAAREEAREAAREEVQNALSKNEEDE